MPHIIKDDHQLTTLFWSAPQKLLSFPTCCGTGLSELQVVVVVARDNCAARFVLLQPCTSKLAESVSIFLLDGYRALSPCLSRKHSCHAMCPASCRLCQGVLVEAAHFSGDYLPICGSWDKVSEKLCNRPKAQDVGPVVEVCT
eukprot:TRINITY_DN111356_c0_g1_i1.p1 TRINITY_DN111356_c0_g1~~TRINITY_DN111356_c0_g1_i1.p1  ORF type:complete len:143 (-),score=20.82 TRINITY_DN111356_c0_g1_i1:49-477(-)